MGEKETMAGADAGARSGTLNVSATPGGSQSASLMGRAASLAETPAGEDQSADLADQGSNERKGPNAVNVKLA
jgi:hypothetical protein